MVTLRHWQSLLNITGPVSWQSLLTCSLAVTTDLHPGSHYWPAAWQSLLTCSLAVTTDLHPGSHNWPVLWGGLTPPGGPPSPPSTPSSHYTTARLSSAFLLSGRALLLAVALMLSSGVFHCYHYKNNQFTWQEAISIEDWNSNCFKGAYTKNVQPKCPRRKFSDLDHIKRTFFKPNNVFLRITISHVIEHFLVKMNFSKKHNLFCWEAISQ